MPSTLFPLLFFFLVVSSSDGPHGTFCTPTFTPSRRILHQPFFPVTSLPPAQPPSPSPSPPPPKYPFSGSTSTPDQSIPFFPTTPSSSPPSPPAPSSPFTSFPANISSLIFPHSPSSSTSPPRPTSRKFLIVTVGLSLLAALIAAVALFFFFRSRRRTPEDKPSRVETPTNAPQPAPPQLRKPSNNSAEFLYLGTLANASSVEGAAGRRSNGRKLQSPELHPLPPLAARQLPLQPPLMEEEDYPQEELYQAPQAEHTTTGISNGGAGKVGSEDSTSSSSSMTSSGSPASISPALSTSPMNTKSSPEFIAVQPRSPPYGYCHSPEGGMETIKEEDNEAEESPLLSSRMTSPMVGTDWGVLGQTSPPLSNASTPTRKSKLPPFLVGVGKRRDSTSSRSTSLTNSPVSPHSEPPSPISWTGSSSSRKSRSYPALPLSNASAGNSPRNSWSARITGPPAPPPPPPPQVLPAMIKSQKPVEEASRSVESEEATTKPRLKPLHWDKVRASSGREMVWDHLKSSSFKLDEEMIETLFVVNAPNLNQKDVNQKPVQPSVMQEARVLDPKKAQNIAILLRALNVTVEEVCEALLEGNAQTLGPELLECLLRMAPTKEEERRLKEYKDDSPVKLGQAEKFLKTVIDIPFAFKRVEAMLYIAYFDSEVEYLKKSFETLEAACDELRNTRMFLKLLEAVLKTGNCMNVGTNRGDARAFKLDTLLKLVDVKGTDGKTTLLHFVVQEIIRTEASADESKCRKLGLQIVSRLSSELANVKKAAAMDSDAITNDVAKLTMGLASLDEVARLNEQPHPQATNRRFSESMNRFMSVAEEEIIRVQAQESVALSLVKEITDYFHGNSAKEEAHPFRIFMVVRDFLAILDRVCKEVGIMIEQTTNRFPVPLNPILPVPVNPLLPQVLPGFSATNRQSSFSEDDSSP